MWRADVPAGVCEQAPCTLAPRASEGADANTRHAGIAYTPYACTQAWAWADKIAPARSPKTARRSMQFHVHRGVPSVSQLVPATRFYAEQHNVVPVALSGRGRTADWLGDDDAAVRAHYRRLRAGGGWGFWRRVNALGGLE